MHKCITLLFSSVVCIVFSNAAKYSGRFDNIDLDEVLQSDRLLKNYFECLMERGPCTAEGSELRKSKLKENFNSECFDGKKVMHWQRLGELRRTIPDALQTDCSKCSETQKNKAAKAIKYLEEHKPDMYKELQQKYDPEGNYREKIRENLHLNETSES